MEPCVYTTQHEGWLNSALACEPSQLVCFRSGKRWATAKRLLDRHGPLPILFRAQDDDSHPVFSCRFIGTLVEIYFVDEFATNEKRLHWLDNKLWFQRSGLQKKWQTNRFPTWEAQYQELEIDKFMAAKTWYRVGAVRRIEPLPLPRLRKLDGDHPLAPDYSRGYALCHYPPDEIRIMSGSTAV